MKKIEVKHLADPLTWLGEGNPKLVVGLTGSHRLKSAWNKYTESGRTPHYTVDASEKTVYENVDTSGACTLITDHDPLAVHRQSSAYFMLITRNVGQNIPNDVSKYLSSTIVDICSTLGVPLEIHNSHTSLVDSHKCVMSVSEFKNFSGIVCLSCLPGGNYVDSFTLDWLDLKAKAPTKKTSKKASTATVETSEEA